MGRPTEIAWGTHEGVPHAGHRTRSIRNGAVECQLTGADTATDRPVRRRLRAVHDGRADAAHPRHPQPTRARPAPDPRAWAGRATRLGASSSSACTRAMRTGAGSRAPMPSSGSLPRFRSSSRSRSSVACREPGGSWKPPMKWWRPIAMRSAGGWVSTGAGSTRSVSPDEWPAPTETEEPPSVYPMRRR